MDRAGELVRVPGPVHWKYELGDRTRSVQRSQARRPALLFESIAGHEGFRVLTNGLGSHDKLALALGIGPGSSFRDIVGTFRSRSLHSVPPVRTAGSAFGDNVFIEDEVDLERLPAPWFSEQDAGRYVGTWHLNITRDPDTGAPNVGVYRMQLLGPRQTAVSISPHSHLAVHLAKAERQGVPLAMAVAIGVDETLVMAAAAGVPAGADEYRLAGALAGEPVAVVSGTTVDLDIPAGAEIVLEGTIDPRRRIAEGPFLDYAGVPKSDPRAFVFDVSCLMYRSDPIFRGAAIGVPGGEDHVLFSVLAAAGCLDFHGSRVRHVIQNALIRQRAYRLFQRAGSLRHMVSALAPGGR